MSRSPTTTAIIRSAFYIVAPLKPLHTPTGIHHPSLSGIEWVALTAHLNLQLFLGRAGGKLVAADTNYLGIIIVLGMNLFLHNR